MDNRHKTIDNRHETIDGRHTFGHGHETGFSQARRDFYRAFAVSCIC